MISKCKDTIFSTNYSSENFLVPPACRVVGGQSRKMAKPIFGRGVSGAV